MTQIVSSTVIVQKKFSIQKMLEIHQEVKKITGSVYLQRKQKIIDASSLTKLVSFLLTVEPNTTVKLIIEAENVEANLQRFAALIKNEATLTVKTCSQFVESSDSYLV